MKNKHYIIASIIVLIFMIFGYLGYNNLFPMAKPIQHLELEDISSIKISINDDNQENIISNTDFTKAIAYFNDVKPTRIMSVNDYPAVRPYYRIEVLTNERRFVYYIYEENNSVYVELPYEGIYVINSKILKVIANWI